MIKKIKSYFYKPIKILFVPESGFAENRKIDRFRRNVENLQQKQRNGKEMLTSYLEYDKLNTVVLYQNLVTRRRHS